MKKQILAVTMAIASTAFAQNLGNNVQTNLEPAPAKAVQAIKANLAKMKADAANKTSAGPISQRMAHYAPVDDLYDIGGTGSGLSFFIDPTFIDSTVNVDFGTIRAVNTHAVGQVFDPTSEAFGFVNQDYFTDNDSYSLDTVYVAGFYDILTSGLVGNTGDKLRLEIVWGQASKTSIDNAVFRQGITFPAGTYDNQTDPIELAPIRYTGASAHGDVGSVDWTGKITQELSLTVSDSNTFFHTFAVNGAMGQMIPAGSVVGVSVKFVPGYTWTAGDIYFAGGGSSSTAVINNWRAYQAGTNTANDNTGYFMEQVQFDPESMATSQFLSLSTRYGIYTGGVAFLNEMMLPGNTGYIFDFWVSGNSSLSLEEDFANAVKVYPNPSNGVVNVSFGEIPNGSYNVRLVNIIGQEVFNQDITVNANEKESFNFENLDKGVYLLNITGNGMNTVQKITLK